MNVRTCDRCGVEINTNPMVTTILPMFSISRIERFAMGWQSVDLCPKCEKKLAEWLNNKEEKSDDTISRQAAIDVVKRLMGDYELSRTVQTGLHILPSAQPENIHFRDCKWHNGEVNQCNAQICASMRGEDFCSRAERREE